MLNNHLRIHFNETNAVRTNIDCFGWLSEHKFSNGDIVFEGKCRNVRE